MKEYAVLGISELETEDIFKRAELSIRKDQVFKELKEFQKEETAIEQVFRLWKGFEELIFNLSQADKHLSISDFEKMTVYRFLSYKGLLIKSIKERNKPTGDVTDI